MIFKMLIRKSNKANNTNKRNKSKTKSPQLIKEDGGGNSVFLKLSSTAKKSIFPKDFSGLM